MLVSFTLNSNYVPTTLCKNYPTVYECIKIKVPKKKKEPYFTWEEYFLKQDIDLLQNINRRNTLLRHNHIIAVPRHDYGALFFSPMPQTVEDKEKQVIVNLNMMAWGAYKNGRLVRWGVANGGSKICVDSKKPLCKTPVGEWKVLEKRGFVSRSKLYPLDCADKKLCGFKMLWYIKFFGNGSGIHGARWVHGANLSHSCVRVLPKSARWLNKEFTEIGTKIIIKDY